MNQYSASGGCLRGFRLDFIVSSDDANDTGGHVFIERFTEVGGPEEYWFAA